MQIKELRPYSTTRVQLEYNLSPQKMNIFLSAQFPCWIPMKPNFELRRRATLVLPGH